MSCGSSLLCSTVYGAGSCTPTQLAPELNALQTMQLTPAADGRVSLFTLCGGSVHTHQTEHRTGLCYTGKWLSAGVYGRFWVKPEQGNGSGQELTPVNLRIAREKDRSVSLIRLPCCKAFHRDACWRSWAAVRPHYAVLPREFVRQQKILRNL